MAAAAAATSSFCSTSPSPTSLDKGTGAPAFMASPPIFSPSSDKRFWSTLRSRIDTLLENRSSLDPSLSNQNDRVAEGTKRLKEDSMLLIRGFDSVSQTLSQLSNSLENALQGARDLARPPTMTDILQCTVEKAKYPEELPPNKNEDKDGVEDEDEGKRGLKRKLDQQEGSDSDNPNRERHSNDSKEMRKLNKAKNIAISMATKAATMAIELKSIKSDLCFMQERCTLLEEENKRLRDGFDKGMRPEEDDLVRLQLEALLAEKSRLANENANLSRENRSLHQLVEYHQATSQDLSASYENLIRGMCLDFSSPVEDQDSEEHQNSPIINGRKESVLDFTKSLDKCFEEEK